MTDILDESEASYIDYETFLSPTFSPTTFANILVTSTNNASDTSVDLSTPLSRVLFDVQEIDTHIHDLTTKSSLPLLTHTKTQSASAKRIVDDVSSQVASLTESYQRLEEEVIARHAAAEEVRLAASRLWVTIKIGRAVGRALLLGRQLEAQMNDLGKASVLPSTLSDPIQSFIKTPREDHRAMVRASYTLLTLKTLFAASGRDEEGEHLSRINAANTLRTDLVSPAEQRLRTRAQQIVREFSLSTLTGPSSATGTSAPANATLSATPTPSSTPPPPSIPSTATPTGPSSYAQTEETKSRTTSAAQTLYLLSPTPGPAAMIFSPALLISALQTYLSTQLTSSAASLARALASLPTLPRALTEVSARCQNIVALESLLLSLPAPSHPLLTHHANTATLAPENLLAPLLHTLDTSSLPSFFWRSLASSLSPRVGEILSRGGVAAKSLRGARERVRESLRDAVLRGVEGASSRGRPAEWEREVGVMVGSVVGQLGR